MIDVDKDYYLDVRAILNFINYSDKNPSKETEIIDRYEKNENKSLESAEKTIREITSGNSNFDNISYDLIKTLILQVLAYGYDEEQDTTILPFGLKIAISTLEHEKLLLKKD